MSDDDSVGGGGGTPVSSAAAPAGGRRRQIVNPNQSLLQAFSDLESSNAPLPKPKKVRGRPGPTRKPPRDRWTEDGDALLLKLAEEYKYSNWNRVAEHFPGKTGKQCRFRWYNYLRSDLKNTPWTEEEDTLLVKSVKELGPKWTVLTKLPEFQLRAPNAVKNRFHVLQARVRRMRLEQGLPVDTQASLDELEAASADIHSATRAAAAAVPSGASASTSTGSARTRNAKPSQSQAAAAAAPAASIPAAAAAAAPLTGRKRKSPVASSASAAAPVPAAPAARQTKRARTTAATAAAAAATPASRRVSHILEHDSLLDDDPLEEIESDTEEALVAAASVVAGARRSMRHPLRLATAPAPALGSRYPSRRPQAASPSSVSAVAAIQDDDDIEDVIDDEDASTDSPGSHPGGPARLPGSSATGGHPLRHPSPLGLTGVSATLPTPGLLRRNPLLAGSSRLTLGSADVAASEVELLSRLGSAPGSLPSSQPSSLEAGAAAAAFARGGRGPVGAAAAAEMPGISATAAGLRGLSAASQGFMRLSPSRPNLFSRMDSLADFSGRMSLSQGSVGEAGAAGAVPDDGLLRRASSTGFGRFLAGSPPIRLGADPLASGPGASVGAPGGNSAVGAAGGGMISEALSLALRLQSARDAPPSSQDSVSGAGLGRQDSFPSSRLLPANRFSAVFGQSPPQPPMSPQGPAVLHLPQLGSQGSLLSDSRLLLREDSQPSVGKLYRLDSGGALPNPYSLSQS